MKYYCTGEPIGEFFKVVIPEMKEPEKKDYGEYNGHVWTDWDTHLTSLPQAALTKINKKGFLENVEERYEVENESDMGRGHQEWFEVDKDIYDGSFPHTRRIILVSKTPSTLNLNRKFERMTGIYNARQENEYHLPLEKPKELTAEDFLNTALKSENFMATQSVKMIPRDIAIKTAEGYAAYKSSKAPEERSQDQLWDELYEDLFAGHPERLGFPNFKKDTTTRLKSKYSITPKAE